MKNQLESFLEESQIRLNHANYLISITYNLFRDPKVFLSVIDNIFLSQINVINTLAILKGINPNKKIEEKINILKKEENLFKDKLDFVEETIQIIKYHKKSPVEFVRKEKYVICDKNYKYRSLTLEKVFSMIKKTAELRKKALKEIEYV